IEHQFRYPFQAELIEIPAGKLDYAEEDHLEAAQRELREETGIVASQYEYLGPFYPTCAYSTEVIHLYLARGLSFGERELDEDESINFEMVSLERMVDLVLQGKVPDGKTQAAILAVWAKLRRDV
ncbi:MAG: NUDIX hydrolase, partial [Spirochaetales bacterium]|nr:NUDIX hydrolase [Spirochaetales bacterium]